jgi:hypothetical protein
MKYTDQLKNDGAVIGYKPNLQLSKTEQSTDVIQQQNEETITLLTQYATDYSQYSKTIQGYLKNTPAIVLDNIHELQSTIIGIKERLITEYNKRKHTQFNDLDDFIYSIKNKTEYAIEVINATDVIDGDIIPQILKILSDEEDFVSNLEETFKKLYYGNSNISESEQKALDNELIKTITNNDLAGFGNHYLALAKDGQLNKTICIFTDYLDSALLKLEDCAYITSQENIFNPELKDAVTILYNDTKIEQEQTAKIYEEQHKALDTCTKSLYNYYDKRNKMNQYYALLLEGGSDSEYLFSKIHSFTYKTDKAIEELTKTLLSNVNYIDSMDKCLSEKQRLNLLFATISYN